MVLRFALESTRPWVDWLLTFATCPGKYCHVVCRPCWPRGLRAGCPMRRCGREQEGRERQGASGIFEATVWRVKVVMQKRQSICSALHYRRNTVHHHVAPVHRDHYGQNTKTTRNGEQYMHVIMPCCIVTNSGHYYAYACFLVPREHQCQYSDKAAQ